MNIECFVSENHMCNLGERLFNEIFDLDAIAELAMTSLLEKLFIC